MQTDPISQLLIQLKNAAAVSLPTAVTRYSKLKFAICKTLQDEGYIHNFESKTKQGKSNLVINIDPKLTKHTITDVMRISKPGRRLYVSYRSIPRPRYGKGVILISTPNGIMSGYKAKKQSLGGELIAEVL